MPALPSGVPATGRTASGGEAASRQDGDTPEVTGAPDDALTAGDVSREIRNFARRQERRRRLVPRAALVGVLAGLTAAAFRHALEAADRLRNGLLQVAHTMPPPWGLALVVATCATAAGAALWLVRRFAPETSGSGIPHL